MSAPERDHARERALVVAALAGVVEGSWPVRQGLDAVDWAWLLPRTVELGVAARLWSELVRAGREADLPADVRTALSVEAQEAAAGAALRAEVARRAGAVLDRAGIPWMPMKGAALALVVPDHAVTRPAIDVDLVVPPDYLERAGRALAAAQRLTGERRDYDGAARDADAAMRDGVQHLYVFEGLGGVQVELHHAFPALTRREITADLFARARPVHVRGATVRVPALDDLLGTACVHALLVHPGDRRSTVRHLSDVSALLARGASAEVAALRYDVGGRTTVADSLHELDVARVEARAPGAPPCAAGLALEPGAAGRLRGWAGRVGGRGAVIAGGLRRHGLGVVLPPRAFMVSLYGPRAAGPRLPLLHLHRWGAILLRTLRGR